MNYAKNKTSKKEIHWEKISLNHFRQIKKYSLKKFRNQHQKTIVEGFRAIKQIADNNLEFEEIYSTSPKIAENLKARKYYILEKWQLEKIVSTQTPQQIAGLIEIRNKPITDKDFLVYLDGIKEPGNLGTIIRTAFAAGVSGLVLSPETCELFSPKVVRSSLGTVFSLPIEIHDYDWLKNQKAKIIVTSAKEGENLFRLRLSPGKIILVIGSEAFGISRQIMEFADLFIKIPMKNNVESLNAAIAAGISIFYLKSLF